MGSFIDPKEFNNTPIATTANGVKIYPRDIKPGKFKKSKRIAPVIGQRRKLAQPSKGKGE